MGAPEVVKGRDVQEGGDTRTYVVNSLLGQQKLTQCYKAIYSNKKIISEKM